MDLWIWSTPVSSLESSSCSFLRHSPAEMEGPEPEPEKPEEHKFWDTQPVPRLGKY